MLATTMPSMPCAVRSIEKPSRSASGAIALRAKPRVERHAAAEQAARREPPEHEVGVGDGRLGAAAAVAGRARLRAGALRPDLQQPVAVEPGDRAAAGADRIDVERQASRAG